MSWTPESGCVGKRIYFAKAEAKQWARAVTAKNLQYGDRPVHLYKCPCGYYHIGHPIGSRGEAA